MEVLSPQTYSVGAFSLEIKERPEVYEVSKFMSFVLTKNKTIVINSGQAFLIRYDHRNYRKQLVRLRELIRQGQIKSMTDLIEYCNFRPGNYHGLMCGLEMVYTRLERHV